MNKKKVNNGIITILLQFISEYGDNHFVIFEISKNEKELQFLQDLKQFVNKYVSSGIDDNYYNSFTTNNMGDDMESVISNLSFLTYSEAKIFNKYLGPFPYSSVGNGKEMMKIIQTTLNWINIQEKEEELDKRNDLI